MNGEQPAAAAANAGKRKADGCLTGLAPLFGIGGLVAGLVMILCTGGKLAADQSGPGAGVAVGGITLGVLLAGWVMRGRGVTQRQLAAGVPALLVLALSVGVVLASVVGLLVRSVAPATYHARAGTLVTAQLVNGCKVDLPAKIRRGTTIDIECEGATWEADGRSRRGTIVVDGDDMSADFKPPAEVRAYVIDDKGYSPARAGLMPSIGSWGAVPLWPLLPALALGVAAGFVLRRIRWSADQRP